MAVNIFAPQKTEIVKSIKGNNFLIYGNNSLGKTSQAVKFRKPLVLATEPGLTATHNIPYLAINNWRDFVSAVNQLTGSATHDKARELYDTIVVDEIYALSLRCINYVCNVDGNGATDLSSPNPDPNNKNKHTNLYQCYERRYFTPINALLMSDYTVIFIDHAADKDGKMFPKGDKRCVDPVKDFCDYTVYLKGNGTDKNGNVIPSSAFLAETKHFFARSRFDTTPTYIEEWNAKNLIETVEKGIALKAKALGTDTVSYDNQKNKPKIETYDYEALMDELAEIGQKYFDADQGKVLHEIVETVLGPDKKVADCTKYQSEALAEIRDELKNRAEALKIAL